MASVKWIKIVTDIFDDEKILLIETLPEADSIIVIWFKLLCLAGKQNNSGVFMLNDRMPYNEKMFATIFRRKETTIQLALKTFEEFGMIEILDGAVTIPNWGKHQTLDQIEQKNEYMRKYMRQYREKQKKLACKTNSKANSKANVSYADIEEDKNKKENKNKGNSRFAPPSFDEVMEYCLTRNNQVDPQTFIDFYESKGWMIGKNKMKDWKAAVRTWEKRETKTGNPFKEALRKELQNEQSGSNSDNDGYQGGLSKLLQEPSRD